jgi:hypothetical protein
MPIQHKYSDNLHNNLLQYRPTTSYANYSAVSTVTRQLGWTIHRSIPSTNKKVSLLKNVQTSYEAHPASYSVGTLFLRQFGDKEMKLIAHLQPEHKLSMSGALSPLHLYAFMACTGTLPSMYIKQCKILM